MLDGDFVLFEKGVFKGLVGESELVYEFCKFKSLLLGFYFILYFKGVLSGLSG